jgi:predicted peroxiredoxin
MKTMFISVFILVLFSISCNQKSLNEQNPGSSDMAIAIDSTRDGIFIHITESYNDPHKVLMPLKMASLMASDKDVIVYMDIHAVELLVKGAKDLNYADFESFQTYLRQLIDKKIGIYACPTCLKIAGYEAGDLMEGVQLAQKDKFFEFTQGKIVSLDY